MAGSDGHVVEARADDLFAVFEQPHAALLTAMTIQRELRARTWPDGLEVRVRAGIHSGYPTSTENNYIGMAVHTTARISAAAHGGQIIVSCDTRHRAHRESTGGRAVQATRPVPPARHPRRGAPLPGRAPAASCSRFPPLRT